MASSADLQRSKNPLRTILLAGFVAGTLDACAAMIQFMIKNNGANPLKVWRYVASGALGSDALQKDLVTMGIIGLLFHFLIAFLFTLFFFFIFPKIKILWKNLVVTGLLYGIFVWLVMNLLVVPLSNVPERAKLWATITNPDGSKNTVLQLPPNPTQMIIGILIIMFCVGLSISLIVGSYFRKQRLKM